MSLCAAPRRLLAAGLLACALMPTQAGAQAAASARAPSITPVVARVADDSSTIRVLLAPAQETTLGSQLSARIQSMNVSLGQSFTKGEPLVRFECDEQQARLKMSEAELAAARESHEAKLR